MCVCTHTCVYMCLHSLNKSDLQLMAAVSGCTAIIFALRQLTSDQKALHRHDCVLQDVHWIVFITLFQ